MLKNLKNMPLACELLVPRDLWDHELLTGGGTCVRCLRDAQLPLLCELAGQKDQTSLESQAFELID